MEMTCPNASKCPIFSGVLSDKKSTAASYKSLFCESGEEKWNQCKRFLTKAMYGKCPPELLPNSILTLEQIGKRYQLV